MFLSHANLVPKLIKFIRNNHNKFILLHCLYIYIYILFPSPRPFDSRFRIKFNGFILWVFSFHYLWLQRWHWSRGLPYSFHHQRHLARQAYGALDMNMNVRPIGHILYSGTFQAYCQMLYWIGVSSDTFLECEREDKPRSGGKVGLINRTHDLCIPCFLNRRLYWLYGNKCPKTDGYF